MGIVRSEPYSKSSPGRRRLRQMELYVMVAVEAEDDNVDKRPDDDDGRVEDEEDDDPTNDSGCVCSWPGITPSGCV